MKICDQSSHHNALQIIDKKGVLNEIRECVNQTNISFVRGTPSIIKKFVNEMFNSLGWADKIKLKNSRLSINFLKSRVGVCFQIGNVARMYADILKICYLFDEGIIDAGVICVPHQIESKLLGANYARFDRLKNEITLFQKIIKAPILILCLSN